MRTRGRLRSVLLPTFWGVWLRRFFRPALEKDEENVRVQWYRSLGEIEVWAWVVKG